MSEVITVNQIFCKDCMHYNHKDYKVGVKPMCKVDLTHKISPVDAKLIDIGKMHTCESNRSTIGWLFGHCGPKAKFFEPKTPIPECKAHKASTTNTINRIEIIGPEGRIFTKHLDQESKVDLLYQDGGKTLKVVLSDDYPGFIG